MKAKKQKVKSKKKKLRSWVIWVIIIILSAVLVYSGYGIYKWFQDNHNIKKITKNLEDDFEVEKIDDEGELINPPDDKESDYWYYTTLPFYNVNFDNLTSKNKDTVAFIHMDNTNINYPVVQTSNNDYYLNHAFDKSKNSAGWVFMDYRNSLNPLNDNTIIYGHGRLDKTVFGSLKNVLTKSWQQNKENYVIWLSTKTENMVFQIFSIYTIPSESYYITTSFANENAKNEWLKTMKERNVSSTNTEVNAKDYILTLSTCQNTTGDRIVVQAKLIKRQSK